MEALPWFILPSFYMGNFRTESLVTPLPTDKIEYCIRACFLSCFPSYLFRTDRIFVHHWIFKLLTEERKLRYYSMVQMKIADYLDAQKPDSWDDIPLPSFPDEYSSVEMELISGTKVLVDLSKLDELRFLLPMGLDHAILCDSPWPLDSLKTRHYLTVWEIFSES